jgi:hypothetical protein
MRCAKHGWYSYEDDGCRKCQGTVEADPPPHADDCALVQHWDIKMVTQSMVDPESPRWLECCGVLCSCRFGRPTPKPQ